MNAIPTGVLTSSFNIKRKSNQKTYSTQTKRRLDLEEPPRKRQCSWEAVDCPVRASSTDKQGRHGRPSSSIPSSPIQDYFHAVFSDQPDDDRTTPPSSPPAQVSPGKIDEYQYSLSRKKARTTRRSISRVLAPVDNNRRRHATREKRRMTQLQIDLGGEIRTTCKGCGMDYIPSSTEDTMWHKRFHAMNLGGVDLGRPTLKTLQSKKIWVEAGSTSKTSAPFIAIVDAKSSTSERKKAKEILAIVNTELSAAGLEDEVLWGLTNTVLSKQETLSQKIFMSQASIRQVPRFRLLLYINGSKCTGLCLAERITKAYKIESLAPSSPSSLKSAKRTHISSSVSITNIEEPALLGISRIWTSKHHRRNGIASALLQAARCNFLFGMEIPKALVAFSQPTESGGALAKAWFGENDRWLVYREG